MKSNWKKIKEIQQPLLDEILSSKVIEHGSEIKVIEEINKELSKFTCQSWFNVKMILYLNRYAKIGRDEFLDWIETTKYFKQLRDIV